MTDRLITIKAFGNKRTQYNAATGSAIMKGKQMPITPFRAAMNAGDEAGSVNSGVLSHLYAPSQANGIGNMSKHFNAGGNSTGESAYTGNQNFVYDGSDYTRFKKLQAYNRERGAATAAAASSGNTYNITVTFASTGNYGLTGNDRDGAVIGNDPAVNINVGDTITFTVNSGAAHPFYIKHTAATDASITNQVSNPVATGTGAYGGQGAYGGSTISWTPDSSAAGNTYYYQCGVHEAMQGQIIVT